MSHPTSRKGSRLLSRNKIYLCLIVLLDVSPSAQVDKSKHMTSLSQQETEGRYPVTLPSPGPCSSSPLDQQVVGAPLQLP